VEKGGKNGGKDFPNKSSLIEVALTQKRKIIRLGPKKNIFALYPIYFSQLGRIQRHTALPVFIYFLLKLI
jgi:hypothetical protein